MVNENKKRLLLPLQFFAEPGDAGTETGAAEDKGTTEEKDKTPPKTYTESEVDAERSRAVDAALKRKEMEFQRLLEKAKEDGLVKGKTYSQLTEEQRKEQDLADKLTRIEERERELNNRERLASITADLQEANMPLAFAEILAKEESNEKAKAIVKDLKKAWDEAINAKIKETLRQADPKTGNTGSGKTKTAAELIAEARNKQNQNQGYDPWAKK